RGSYKQGTTITVGASASDVGSGVNRVEFYAWSTAPWSNQTWVYLGQDTTSPYSYSWNVSGLPEGNSIISATIYDNAGNNSGMLWGDSNWTWMAIDRTPPSSSVLALPSQSETLSFPVRWSATDNYTASDLIFFDVQYQIDCTGTWYNWVFMDNFGMNTFTGDYDRSYCFRSRGYYLAGNVEAWSATPDATTTMPTSARVILFNWANYQNQKMMLNLGVTAVTGLVYSMEIPAGWTVETWSNTDYRCWEGSVPNLQDHGWHDQVKTIQVHNNDVCAPTGTMTTPQRSSYQTGGAVSVMV
ncbi:MAG TPA: Ig-like domain-containing protein, partial [Aggregatilineales bacterium]|nr:Ig-like domain-containing protein [Aggregatilineales bacterium]